MKKILAYIMIACMITGLPLIWQATAVADEPPEEPSEGEFTCPDDIDPDACGLFALAAILDEARGVE